MNQPLGRNAVYVMRPAQRALAQPKLPSKVNERNNKDKLFNALVDDLEGRSLFWRADEVDSFSSNRSVMCFGILMFFQWQKLSYS